MLIRLKDIIIRKLTPGKMDTFKWNTVVYYSGSTLFMITSCDGDGSDRCEFGTAVNMQDVQFCMYA